MDGNIATSTPPAINDDDVIVDHIDHNSPVVAPSVGNLRPGPTFDTPSPNYGVYSILIT